MARRARAYPNHIFIMLLWMKSKHGTIFFTCYEWNPSMARWMKSTWTDMAHCMCDLDLSFFNSVESFVYLFFGAEILHPARPARFTCLQGLPHASGFGRGVALRTSNIYIMPSYHQPTQTSIINILKFTKKNPPKLTFWTQKWRICFRWFSFSTKRKVMFNDF